MTNPTRGAIHLTAHGLSDGDRDLWLVDITGRRVASLERGMRLANGRGEAVWDVAPGRGSLPGSTSSPSPRAEARSRRRRGSCCSSSPSA